MRGPLPRSAAEPQGAGRILSRALSAGGFLWIALGILTLPAAADTIDDALRCLDAELDSRQKREVLLAQADSLGRRIEEVRRAGKDAPENWLRQAEKIQADAMDRELDWMTARELCRQTSRAALRECSRRIAVLESAVQSGRGTPEQAAELLRLQRARTRLEGALSGPAVVSYPSLPADPSDTQEVLRLKLQYYQDVQGYLGRLQERVSSRLEQVERERQVLAEAQRFLRDQDFVDEAGRVSLGGSAAIPGLPPTGGASGGAARGVGSAGLGEGGVDLEFALGMTPVTPEQSDDLILLLQGFRREIQRELDRITTELDAVQRRILPEGVPPR